MLNPICDVFPLVGTQCQDGTLCENVSQFEALNCSTSYLASTKLNLRCLVGFYSKCASESYSVWHYEDTSHSVLSASKPHSRLLAVFKKYHTKAKVGQMNWWTKLLLILYIIFKINKVFSTNNNYLAQLSAACSYFVFISWLEVRHLRL